MDIKVEIPEEDKELRERLERKIKLKKSIERAENSISKFSSLLAKYNKEKKNGNAT